MTNWSPESWKTFRVDQAVDYGDKAELDAAEAALRGMPPLVTSFEVERLKERIAAAQRGESFILQGGDCAETLADCRPEFITNKLKILLQMSLVLVHRTRRSVVRIGRMAGQYAKPRSQPLETRMVDGKEVSLPNYFGDLVNQAEFSEDARRIDPKWLVEGYKHAGLTLNFIRSLTKSGFADLHHPEYWNVAFLESAHLDDALRERYRTMRSQVEDAVAFMRALAGQAGSALSEVDFFVSHEGLNLPYESAQTRQVPRRDGWYDLSTHLPWIGERTRALDGAHIEFFRGINNPVGVKLGPTTTPDILMGIIDALNPNDEAGKLVLITRFGAGKVDGVLPQLVERVQKEGRQVLWVSDPMHGNTHKTASGIKTRAFEDILSEVSDVIDTHRGCGTILGGVHFELTGEDVTECVGAGIDADDLSRNYATACDPRLNYQQALEMAFRIADKLGSAT